MEKADLIEIQYIAKIINVVSIMEKGILSHNMMKFQGLNQNSISMEEVQDRREKAEYWTDQDPISKRKKTVAKCAEVLIPDVVPSAFIIGAHVSCDDTKLMLSNLLPTLRI